MSTQSTPRSARSASRNISPAGMLTPSRKIKAMLAQFDSDSDEDDSSVRLSSQRIAPPRLVTSASQPANLVIEQEDDEDVPVPVPRGRMAARMQGLDVAKTTEVGPRSETAYDRVSKILKPPSEDPTATDNSSDKGDQSCEDDMPNAAPARRRLLLQAKDSAKPPTKRAPVSSTRTLTRSESPFFVEEESEDDVDTESNFPTKENVSDRLLALIEQKRKERLDKERREALDKAISEDVAETFDSDMIDGQGSDHSDVDGESDRRLTQTSRPARKASKKALEEMARETQRLSRNRQLAYQPRVKRKITIESFVALMNSHPKGQVLEKTSSSASSSSAPSDVDTKKQKETPPTSPVVPQSDDPKSAPNQDTKLHSKKTSGGPTASKMNRFRVRMSREEVARRQREEPDDDLEIITSPTRCRKTAIFENFRSKNSTENKGMLKLRLLARLTSPRRTKSMSPVELATMLRLKARQQALQERQERIEELQAKGVVIETAEEREAMEADIEDLMEKARREADAIARREKAAREEKSGKDDNEDNDFVLSGSEDDEEGDEELSEEGSGSDNEIIDSGDESGVDLESPIQDLVDGEANEGMDSDSEPENFLPEDEELLTRTFRGGRQRRVVSDDEEEEEENEVNEIQPTAATQEPKTPAKSVATSVGSAQRPYFPNMPGSSSFAMSLTQAFAGTIAENQSAVEEYSSKVLQSLPDPARGNLSETIVNTETIVKDSQVEREGSLDLFADYTQSNTHVSDSPGPSWSQVSQMPEPTQDIGFVYSPIDTSKRFVEPPVSTIDTVILAQSQSPTLQRKKRLLHRGRLAPLSHEEGDEFEIKASAFNVLKKVSKKKPEPVVFDKTHSKAKEHIDEAAEESEDEYAGLGGASDDDNGEEDELDREMINDSSNEVVDEKELAALNANHQRAMDEKQVSKLLKDITTGALRRRRGAGNDLDLDDSDDERMARRKAKQREFAKMRKALLADEKVSEIASHPKKQAFFKALEDRDEDADFELEFDGGSNLEEAQSEDSQAEKQSASGAKSGSVLEHSSLKRKRPLVPASEDIANRPVPHLRRTPAAVSRKPSSLAEIRETLSFLTATPEYDSFREDASIDPEIVYSTDKNNSTDDRHDKNGSIRESSGEEFAIPTNPRRTGSSEVVDRLALRRAASSKSAYTNVKPAFVTNQSSWDTANIGFRPPPLLRRATSSWSTSGGSSSSFSSVAKKTSSVPKPIVSNPSKGAVNYYTAARERERERDLRLKERDGRKITAAKIAKLQKKSLKNGLLAWSKKESGFDV